MKLLRLQYIRLILNGSISLLKTRPSLRIVGVLKDSGLSRRRTQSKIQMVQVSSTPTLTPSSVISVSSP